jgi:TonB family protein
MAIRVSGLPEVFTTKEIAAAAGVGVADARALVVSGSVNSVDGEYLNPDQAVRAVRILKGRQVEPVLDRQLFRVRPAGERRAGGPLAASSALHGAVIVCLLLLGTVGVTNELPLSQTRLIFLAQPGPGGGGGGGGLRQPQPVRRALLKSASALRSPVPVERAVRREVPDPPKPKPTPPPPPQPTPKPVEPPPPIAKPDPIPPVVAPVVSASPDTRDQAGVLTEKAPEAGSQGKGAGGGSGTGGGTGIGEGTGPGIGPGSGGGTGGGPYRPGSGIAPPELLHEVKPEYTDEARRRSLRGDVLLEIVVRSDGRVGDVRVVRGLGSGLDERAVQAVRQWRFSPARRLGTPVDVMVEVAVEFRLR